MYALLMICTGTTEAFLSTSPRTRGDGYVYQDAKHSWHALEHDFNLLSGRQRAHTTFVAVSFVYIVTYAALMRICRGTTELFLTIFAKDMER